MAGRMNPVSCFRHAGTADSNISRQQVVWEKHADNKCARVSRVGSHKVAKIANPCRQYCCTRQLSCGCTCVMDGHDVPFIYLFRFVSLEALHSVSYGALHSILNKSPHDTIIHQTKLDDSHCRYYFVYFSSYSYYSLLLVHDLPNIPTILNTNQNNRKYIGTMRERKSTGQGLR